MAPNGSTGRKSMAEREVAPIKPCPICKMTGWGLDGKNNDDLCWVCGGRGWIIEDVCLGCGRPAFDQLNQPVPYCGDVDCLKSLLKIYVPTKPVLDFGARAARLRELAKSKSLVDTRELVRLASERRTEGSIEHRYFTGEVYD